MMIIYYVKCQRVTRDKSIAKVVIVAVKYEINNNILLA